MVDKKIVKDILQAEFGAPMATEAQRQLRAQYVVRHVGTTSATANVERMIEECKDTPATWHWHDGSTTVVDIRPKGEGSVVLQPVHLGKGETGQRRKAALEKMAADGGHTWNGKPSIGKMLVAMADEATK